MDHDEGIHIAVAIVVIGGEIHRGVGGTGGGIADGGQGSSEGALFGRDDETIIQTQLPRLPSMALEPSVGSTLLAGLL